jgi:hypothetical protein
MAVNAKPRTQDHWSVRLHIKRPGGPMRVVLIVLALVQALLLYLTASSFAANGGLYGCSTPCATPVPGAPPPTPLASVLYSIIILLLPAVMGALSQSWEEAVMLAAVPWLLAVIFTAGSVLAPAYSVIPATRAQPAASHFAAPFWLDPARITPLLFALALFIAIGWLGWVVREAVVDG